MKIVGLTGGIGSGKTSVLNEFASLGVPCYQADETAKKLMHEDQNIIEAIKANFGEEIYSGSQLDKKKLAAIVFDNKKKSLLDNSFLLAGKQILILDSQSYCPYCEKLKENVTDSYKGSIPLTYRTSDQLHGLKINSPTWATPSIIFLENGLEVFAYQGYIEPKEFYKLLGRFKLGNSEAYNVAFNKGTDARFCKEYEIFKNTPNGVFLDKLSGEPLFDTDDRFVSRSGWLSFTKPVSGSVYELPDNSYGMKRIEIRSVSSGIHLGHVFNDGPNGMPRYCINATVLEFKARKDLS